MLSDKVKQAIYQADQQALLDAFKPNNCTYCRKTDIQLTGMYTTQRPDGVWEVIFVCSECVAKQTEVANVQ